MRYGVLLIIASLATGTVSTFSLLRASVWSAHHRAESSLLRSGLFGEQTVLDRVNITNRPSVEWQIYIDQSKASLDRGASATLDAFCGLCPPSKVQVFSAVLPKSNKKTPWVRIVAKVPGKSNVDVTNVDSLDKVYRILTKYLQIEEVSKDAFNSLKWKYKGNVHLEAGKVTLAIDAYSKALGKCSGTKQEGAVLLLRATAYSRQAQSHKEALQDAVREWKQPQEQGVQSLLSEALLGGSERAGLSSSIIRKLHINGKKQQTELRKIQHRHGLYQYALLHATQDSLRATEILPSYSAAWLQAGELLGQLWKIKESRQYHEKAQSLDGAPESRMELLRMDLKRRQELLDQVQSRLDWKDDYLRLALDIAG